MSVQLLVHVMPLVYFISSSSPATSYVVVPPWHLEVVGVWEHDFYLLIEAHWLLRVLLDLSEDDILCSHPLHHAQSVPLDANQDLLLAVGSVETPALMELSMLRRLDPGP